MFWKKRDGVRIKSPFHLKESQKALLAVALPKNPNLKMAGIQYDPDSNQYINTSVERGFPLGSIGSGVVNLDTSGGFQKAAINNNWMSSIPHLKGSFWALYLEHNKQKITRILRQKYSGGEEYSNCTPISNVKFSGHLPGFTMEYSDDFPVKILIDGFSPLIPHNVKDSSLPAATFNVRLLNTGEKKVTTAFLFSWENILGKGGTGPTGVATIKDIGVGCLPRIVYDCTKGNYHKIWKKDNLQGIEFLCRQQYPENCHRRSVTGKYLLTVEACENFEITYNLGWPAANKKSTIMEDFQQGGTLCASFCKESESLAAAISVKTDIPAGECVEIPFQLIWWLPDHVTEMNVIQNAKKQKYNGVEVGHYYQNYFSCPTNMASYLSQEQQRLLKESLELNEILERSSFPKWLKVALCNATDSIRCNTVLPKSGNLYTIEGQDWRWNFGGLTGTMDQRLASHPYTSIFFTELDRSELDTFRKLSINGSIPHGNGNCDLGLNTAEVPYGWPPKLRWALPEDKWPDLTLSYILQFYRLYQILADQKWLKEAWPDIEKMFNHLQKMENKHGIPEGGSTYDVCSFAGSFCYTATLYIAALMAGEKLAIAMKNETTAQFFLQKREKVRNYVENTLWNSKGFYQSTENQHTLFLGSLAGDWMARWSGLGPVLNIEKTRIHIENQQRVLLANLDWKKTGKTPLPFSEATIDGTGIPTKFMFFFKVPPYIWQVKAYHAMEAIYLNRVKEGLDALKLFYDCYYYKGYPWSADLWGASSFVYMTHTVIWALPNVINGAALDMNNKTLTLSPRKISASLEQTLPIFFPQFWALVYYNFASNCAKLTVYKNFGSPCIIEKLVFVSTENAVAEIPLDSNLSLEAGNTFNLNIDF